MSLKLRCSSLIHWKNAPVNNILATWLKSRRASEIKARETWNSGNMWIVNKVLRIQLIKIFISRKFLNRRELVTGKVNTIYTLYEAPPPKKDKLKKKKPSQSKQTIFLRKDAKTEQKRSSNQDMTLLLVLQLSFKVLIMKGKPIMKYWI